LYGINYIYKLLYSLEESAVNPTVNTEEKMPKAMLDALTLHETFCVASKIDSVTTEQVKEFLEKRFNKKLADQFKPEYLFRSQGV
jgi:hypothetical protein